MLFESQLVDAIKNYPNLKIVRTDSNVPYLKGILDIPNDNNEIVGNFLVEVKTSNGFPYRFPILYETGGEIPNESDWHKYSDSSCCITVWPEEIVTCRSGITVDAFIRNQAIPYLANQIFRKEKGYYKNGEYAHYTKGISQFYEELMKTSDWKLWLQYFKQALRGEKVSCGRNEMCFCGANVKFKNCHLKVFDTLRQIGGERVLNDFELIMQ